jgi:uncharacterized protein (TIGR01244 family)
MTMIKLSESLAVSPQIAPEDVAEIAAAGYKVLINNRPDGEAQDQPASAEIASAAQAAGLEYHHMPVTMMNFPGPDFDAMTDLMDDPERPVFAFCRTGTRCANLWVSSQDPAEQPAAADQASGQGFDLGMSNNFLNRD